MAAYPYEDRYAVNRTLPEKGRPREEILAELKTMAEEEDAFWETGKCSGTMYCGDHDHIDENTVALVGSACNYGYGTVDPMDELSDLALQRGVGLHVDGCLGGFILPFGQKLGFDVPIYDYRLPGVTSISADTHKYGYAFKGSSVCTFRDKALRNAQYFFLTDWSGGKYCSPGIEGSRSGGLIAATWAAMVSFGWEGYLTYADKIFETSAAMQAAVRSHPE